MKQVEGKVAFITGGASGIGFGIAQAFLRSGMKVIIADVLHERLDEAARILAQGTNRDFRIIKVDVTDRAMMAGAAAEAERAFGKVHVLCNNAGVTEICRSKTQATRIGIGCWASISGVSSTALSAFCPR